MFDTGNHINNQNPQETGEGFAERFLSPYARTSLNNVGWLKQAIEPPSETEDKQLSEQRSAHLLRQYFKLINTHLHGVTGGIVESESFEVDYKAQLPKCYDIPKFREAQKGSKEEGS